MRCLSNEIRTLIKSSQTMFALFLLAAMLLPCIAAPICADYSGRPTVFASSNEDNDFGSYSDDELLALAEVAEENCRDYTTVSNGKVALELPYANEHLSEPLRMEVKFTKNGAIFIMPRPKTGGGVLGTVKAGTDVTVIAESNKFYFFITEDGRMGWNGKDYFEEIVVFGGDSGRTTTAKVNAAEYDLYSRDELTTLAKEAEANSRDYTTVSNKKVALELPYADDYLPDPLQMEVKFSKNGAILIMPMPKTGKGSLGSITAGTEVTVIAEYKTYYFFVADDGRMGWCGKSYLTA